MLPCGVHVNAACPEIQTPWNIPRLSRTELWHRAINVCNSSVWLICVSACVPLGLRMEWVRFRMAMDWISAVQTAEPALLLGGGE